MSVNMYLFNNLDLRGLPLSLGISPHSTKDISKQNKIMPAPQAQAEERTNSRTLEPVASKQQKLAVLRECTLNTCRCSYWVDNELSRGINNKVKQTYPEYWDSPMPFERGSDKCGGWQPTIWAAAWRFRLAYEGTPQVHLILTQYVWSQRYLPRFQSCRHRCCSANDLIRSWFRTDILDMYLLAQWSHQELARSSSLSPHSQQHMPHAQVLLPPRSNLLANPFDKSTLV